MGSDSYNSVEVWSTSIAHVEQFPFLFPCTKTSLWTTSMWLSGDDQGICIVTVLLFPISMLVQTLFRYSLSLEKRWSISPIVISKENITDCQKKHRWDSTCLCAIWVYTPTKVLVLSLETDAWYTGNHCKPLHHLLGQFLLVLPLHLRRVFCSSLVFISYKVEKSNSQIWDLNMGKRKGSFQQPWDCKAVLCQPSKGWTRKGVYVDFKHTDRALKLFLVVARSSACS